MIEVPELVAGSVLTLLLWLPALRTYLIRRRARAYVRRRLARINSGAR